MPPHFSGIVRLFPLPNLVVFPGVVQALHIFEPRYRAMTEDSLAADNLISLCLLRQDEGLVDSSEKPEIHETVCICRIVANNKMGDGKFNLIVVGVKRAEIVRELAVDQPYRMAEVRVIEDEFLVSTDQIKDLRKRLIDSCHSIGIFDKLTQNEEINKILSNDMALGFLADLIAFVSPLNCEQRQTILESTDVENRCMLLVDFLTAESEDSATSNDKFPPDFSSN